MKNNFSFKAEAKKLILYFYGDIVGSGAEKWSGDDVCPTDVREALAENSGKEIELHINSGGGDVFAAVAIANMLSRWSEPKVCYVDGLAASAASVLALSCDQVIMPKNSMLMIHRAWTTCMGNAEDLLNTASILDTLDAGMLEVYFSAAAEDVTKNQLKELMRAESWLTASDSASLFKTVEEAEPLEVAAKVPLPKSAPDSIRRLMDSTNEAELLKLRLSLFSYE